MPPFSSVLSLPTAARPGKSRIGPVTDPLAARREHYLSLSADLPARCRLVETSEGGSLSRKLQKLNLFGTRYVRWAFARFGLKPGIVKVPLFWGGRMDLPYADE